ncbi:MAG: SsrA-binding protein SmpB [Firmicutes bacterium]|nr:SsrA-binding protein SmpB [Bacillota bacterium]
MNIIDDNRKARFDYAIDDKFEAGLSLLGWEVKSARAGNVNLKDSFVYFQVASNGGISAILKNAHFSPFQFGDVSTQETRRDRQLLLNIHEIKKIHNAVKTKGVTCVPLRLYFNKSGRVKLEIAIGKGKHTYDKKQTQKERDIARETRRAIEGM